MLCAKCGGLTVPFHRLIAVARDSKYGKDGDIWTVDLCPDCFKVVKEAAGPVRKIRKKRPSKRFPPPGYTVHRFAEKEGETDGKKTEIAEPVPDVQEKTDDENRILTKIIEYIGKNGSL